AHPHDRNALFRSALIEHDRMTIASDERREEVLIHARNAARMLDALISESDRDIPVHLDGFLRPGDPHESERRGISGLYANVGLAFVNEHRYAEGAAYARRSVELAEPLSTAQDVAGQGLSILANALRYEGDLDGALRAIRQARAFALRARYPNETTRLFN